AAGRFEHTPERTDDPGTGAAEQGFEGVDAAAAAGVEQTVDGAHEFAATVLQVAVDALLEMPSALAEVALERVEQPVAGGRDEGRQNGQPAARGVAGAAILGFAGTPRRRREDLTQLLD